MGDTAPLTYQANPSRTDHELSILIDIGRILSSTFELRAAFAQIMQIISDKLDMHRGALVLLDESAGESPNPGWYRDPDDAAQLRWWNGRSWSNECYSTSVSS